MLFTVYKQLFDDIQYILDDMDNIFELNNGNIEDVNEIISIIQQIIIEKNSHIMYTILFKWL